MNITFILGAPNFVEGSLKVFALKILSKIKKIAFSVKLVIHPVSPTPRRACDDDDDAVVLYCG